MICEFCDGTQAILKKTPAGDYYNEPCTCLKWCDVCCNTRVISTLGTDGTYHRDCPCPECKPATDNEIIAAYQQIPQADIAQLRKELHETLEYVKQILGMMTGYCGKVTVSHTPAEQPAPNP